MNQFSRLRLGVVAAGAALLVGPLYADGTEMLGHWAPGYETFLSSIFRLAGPDPLTPLVAQVALSTWIIVPVYGIARVAGGRRAGRIAAGLAAIYLRPAERLRDGDGDGVDPEYR